MRAMAPRRSLLLLLALILMGSACDPAPADEATSAGPQAHNATTAALLPVGVAELPTFTPQEYQQLLTQLHGTPVVVNVWASWCGPCQAEAPLLHGAVERYGDRVQFVGIDILDTIDGAHGFIRDHDLAYPSLFDPSGAIRDGLGVIGQPVTVFYDENGTVVSTWPGQLTQTALTDGIDKALG
jgi:cytochrome c biogenesis protein CcmG, thiol:disulfide interchange protein DsbE